MFSERTGLNAALGMLAAAMLMVLCQFTASGQSGPTTRGDLLSAKELAKIGKSFINSPPTPPPGFARPLAAGGWDSKSLSSNSLAVPTSTWTYGCTATSAGMIFAFYDRNGYPGMYTGPANGGVCPLTDLGQGINAPVSGACSIIATQNGFDGRATAGHADDYYVGYGAEGPDPWVGVRPEHAWGGCTADYMGTNQFKWDYYSGDSGTDSNPDGGTSYFSNSSGGRLYDFIPPSSYGTPQTEACHGMRLFAESRGYGVTENYTQAIDTLYAGGFSFANYKTEIDAGCPVMIHVSGHTMVGVGYDDAGSTVYLNDTWDNAVHSMTWGGAYSGMAQRAVTVIHLAPDTTPPTGAIVINGNLSATKTASVTLALAWSDGIGSGVTRMRFSDNGTTWSAWAALMAARAYSLPAGDGYKTVRVQYLDRAGNRSAICSDYIRLDTVPPTGGIIINGGAVTTATRSVSLGLNWADTGAGVTRMRFSDNGSTWTAWQSLAATRAHTLPGAVGNNTVRVQYLDGAGNSSPVCSDYIKLLGS
jgi:hypothetical protein